MLPIDKNQLESLLADLQAKERRVSAEETRATNAANAAFVARHERNVAAKALQQFLGITSTLLVLLGVFPSSAHAQTIDRYVSRIYLQGASAPLSTTDLLIANIVCNQTPPSATIGTVNPTRIVFDDPNVVGKVCIWSDPGTGLLASLPFGPANYEGTLAAANSAGQGPESAPRAPFTRPGQPPASAPTGVRYAK